MVTIRSVFRTQSDIYDEYFCENSYRLSGKASILDVWIGSECASDMVTHT